MSIFWGSKKKDELVLVFNVGSSSVGGALFRAQSSGIPKMIYSISEPIQVEEKIDINNFLSLTIKSLEVVVQKVYGAHLGAPSKIFCVLSSPLYVSQTRVISFAKNTPFIFTEKLADGLIQKEIKLFEEEHLIKYENTGNSIRAIEFKNIKITLNGYETSKPLNQKIKELEMSVFISISGEQVLKNIEDTIAKHFHFKQIKFSSFTMASFAVVRDLFISKESFLLIDIGGEVTDIASVKKNILCESISFPSGRNFFIRGVASSLGCTLNEAYSFISLFKDGHAEESIMIKITPIIDKLKTEWLKNLQESLANISNDISIPDTIYIATDIDLANFFSEIIKTEQFNQYTLTESKFKIKILDTQTLHNMAVFEDNIIRDPLLIIDSVYINRFLIYQGIKG